MISAARGHETHPNHCPVVIELSSISLTTPDRTSVRRLITRGEAMKGANPRGVAIYVSTG
jgi:hypothetical protein